MKFCESKKKTIYGGDKISMDREIKSFVSLISSKCMFKQPRVLKRKNVCAYTATTVIDKLNNFCSNICSMIKVHHEETMTKMFNLNFNVNGAQLCNVSILK